MIRSVCRLIKMTHSLRHRKQINLSNFARAVVSRTAQHSFGSVFSTKQLNLKQNVPKIYSHSIFSISLTNPIRILVECIFGIYILNFRDNCSINEMLTIFRSSKNPENIRIQIRAFGMIRRIYFVNRLSEMKLQRYPLYIIAFDKIN